MPISNRIRGCVAAMALLALPAFTQTAEPVAETAPGVRSAYRLGAEDVISIKVTDAEEISEKSLRIGDSGFISLPMVGRVRAAGVTVDELQKELEARLKVYIRTPEVSINLIEMKSQPVSIIGAVKSPGVQQLQGRKTLVEMLSLAGGIREDAGYSVRITRQKEWGPIPLANAQPDPTGQFTIAEVNLKEIMDAKNPVNNIAVMPHDVISVPKGEMVYVIGEVKKPGEFILGSKANLSVLQALSMGGGLENRTAAPAKAKILRTSASADMKRIEIPVNLKNILAGKDQDVPMEPEDILFVPNSRTKSGAIRAAEAALQIATGIAIYRSY
jgi:polysaccharide export outer membrane protein